MSPKRLECMRNLDIDTFKRLIGQTQLNDDQALLALHKARTVSTDLSDLERIVSIEWLRYRGFSGFMGMPLPAEGVLPRDPDVA